MISLNGRKCGTPEASYLIKQTKTSFGEGKNDAKKHLQYKKKKLLHKHQSR